jgi:hypothetical protein
VNSIVRCKLMPQFKSIDVSIGCNDGTHETTAISIY